MRTARILIEDSYIGTLHQIDSESSTVALENVRSYGTEGRRGNPAEEVPASETIYEYIVFKGSDVKDLTILEAPKENKPPQVPNDPAILGVSLWFEWIRSTIAVILVVFLSYTRSQ